MKNPGITIKAIICLMIISFCIISCPAAGTEVTRSFQPVLKTEEDLTEVILSIHGMDIGGIIEKLPPDVHYYSSPFPHNRLNQTDNNLVFAIVNETEIHYLVKGSGMKNPEISGDWVNIRTGESGAVHSQGERAQGGNPPPSSENTERSPGFGFISIILALAVMLLIKERNES